MGHAPTSDCHASRLSAGSGRPGAGRPPAHCVREFAGHLGQHRQPGPHVLRALGVVGGQRGHRVGVVAGGGPSGPVVELLRRHAEPSRIPADLVQRDEPVVAVEDRVLFALGHHHRRGLLDALGQLAVPVAGHLPHQGLDRPGQLGRPPGRLSGGRLQRVRLAVGQVGTVDGEAGEQFDHDLLGLPGLDLLRGDDPADDPRDPAHLRAQDVLGHPPFGGVVHLAQVLVAAFLIGERGERQFAGTVHEQPADEPESVVAGRAVHRPPGRQRFVRAEDLLHHQPRRRRLRRQPPQVGPGIGEAVGMIDAQSGHLPRGHPAEHGGVRGLEDLGVLDPHGRERGDVEEAAVVQLAVRAAPVREPVVLPLVHLLRCAALGARGDGEPQVVVGELAVNDRQVGDRAGVGEDRHHDGRAIPVDVEEPRVRRFAAQPEHVPPRRVGRGDRDAHVIGHDVGDQAQARVLERVRQARERFLAAQGGAGLGGVDDVVTMGRTWRGGQHR